MSEEAEAEVHIGFIDLTFTTEAKGDTLKGSAYINHISIENNLTGFKIKSPENLNG